MSYKNEVLASAPLAYFRLRETDGAAGLASEVGGFTGALRGGAQPAQASLIADDTDLSVDMAGVSGAIQLDSLAPAIVSGQQFTFELWFAWDSDDGTSPYNLLALRQEAVQYREFEVQPHRDGGITLMGGAGDYATVGSDTNYRDGRPHHLVVRMDAEAQHADVYVDGVLLGELSTRINPQYVEHISVGAYLSPTGGWINGFGGSVDELAVYTRILSADEIRRHYGAGLGKSSYALEVLASSPAGYWPLDDAAGSTHLSDAAGDNDAEIIRTGSPGLQLGQPKIVPGGGESSARFGEAGYQGYARVFYTEALAPTEALTMEAWVQFDDTASRQVIFSKTQSGGYSLYTYQEGSTWGLRGIVHDGSGYRAVFWPGFAAGEVYHVVVTFDGLALRLYVNGDEVDRDEANEAATIHYQWSNALLIGQEVNTGAGADGDQLKGYLQECAIYRRALTPDEIARHYTVGNTAILRRYLAGTITLDGAPAEVLVRALRWDTAELLGEATSDPADGSYRIEGIEYDGECLVVTQPPAGFRPLAHGPVMAVEGEVEARAYPDIIKAAAPLAYWRLEDADGATHLADSVGGHAAAITGALTFSQTSLVASLPDAASIKGAGGAAETDPLTATPLAIEFWSMLDGTSNETLVGLYLADDARLDVQLNTVASRIEIRLNGTGSFIAPTPINQTTHFVITYDPAGGRSVAYANGEEAGTYSGNVFARFTSPPRAILFGRMYDSRQTAQYSGTLDEVALYPEPLTAQQISEHYLAGIQEQ